MYDAHILSDTGAQNIYKGGKPIGFAINLRINYYRGLPLSCVDCIEIEVDDEPIDPAGTR